MAFTSDLIVSKLAAHYPTAAKTQHDLLKAYWSDALGGNNGGVFKWGAALSAHYGGSGAFADRANAFWTAYTP